MTEWRCPRWTRRAPDSRPRVLLESGRHAEGKRDEHAHGRGHDGELKRERESELDLLENGGARPHRGAEVQPDQPPHPRDELLPEGLVEAEARPLRREAQLDDIAGHDAHKKEDEDRDAEERRDHQEEALGYILPHYAGGFPWPLTLPSPLRGEGSKE